MNGNNTRGTCSAAMHYFGKQMNQLELHEAALLAGRPQALAQHNPRQNPKGACVRRAYVLERLHKSFQYPAAITHSPPPLTLRTDKAVYRSLSACKFI